MRIRSLALAAALGIAAAIPAPPPALAAAATRALLLDNDADCAADPEATFILGEVTAKQKPGRRLRLRAEFFVGGGHEDVPYHLEIGVQPGSNACESGDGQQIRRSDFRTDAEAAGKVAVTIRDPRANFHIRVCNEAGDDCAFAGNFVYTGKRIDAAEPDS